MKKIFSVFAIVLMAMLCMTSCIEINGKGRINETVNETVIFNDGHCKIKKISLEGHDYYLTTFIFRDGCGVSLTPSEACNHNSHSKVTNE